MRREEDEWRNEAAAIASPSALGPYVPFALPFPARPLSHTHLLQQHCHDELDVRNLAAPSLHLNPLTVPPPFPPQTHPPVAAALP